MDKQSLQQKLNLPSSIQVIISKGKSGVWVVDIPKYDIFTEVDEYWEIEDMINDLLCVFFDVPHKLRNTIRYRNIQENPPKKADIESHIIFQKFISSEAERLYK